ARLQASSARAGGGREPPSSPRARGARASVRARRSRGRRQQGHAGVPAWIVVLSPLLCAYGVSCRARVCFDASPQAWRFAPAAYGRIWFPRSRAPWGRGFGTNRGNVPGLSANCITRRGPHAFLPTARTAGRLPRRGANRRACARALVTSPADAPPRLEPPPAARLAGDPRRGRRGGGADDRRVLGPAGAQQARQQRISRRGRALAAATRSSAGAAQL